MKFEQFLTPLLSNWPCLALLLGFYVFFKTLMPGNVLNQGLHSWIEKHSTLLLDPEALRVANSRLESHCQSTDRKAAARNHLKALNARTA